MQLRPKIVPKYYDSKHLISYARKIKGRKNISVLDLGCGSKPYEGWVKKILGSDIKYIGVDFYSKHADVELDVNTTKLPFKKESFDLIICTAVMEHLHNPFFALGEMQRVLKKKGLLLLSVPFMVGVHALPHDYFRYTPFFFYKWFEKGYKIRMFTVSNTWLSQWLYDLFDAYLCRACGLVRLDFVTPYIRWAIAVVQYPFDALAALIFKRRLTYACTHAGQSYVIEKQ